MLHRLKLLAEVAFDPAALSASREITQVAQLWLLEARCAGGRRASCPMVHQYELHRHPRIRVRILVARCSCLTAPPWLCARGKNRKTGPATGSGSDVDAVSQKSDRLAHDEEAYAQTVASCCIEAGESLEDLRHLFARNADPRVVHVDPYARAAVPTAQEDAASRLGVLDRIAYQVAKDSTEEQAITQYRRIGRNHANAYALFQRYLFVLAASLPQHVIDAHRP